MGAATTIAAVASPTGGALRAVLRISGPATRDVVAATCRLPATPVARGAYEGRFDDGAAELPLRLLWFPAPRSFTREDVAELHLPGAAPLVERALARVLAAGATLAQPGEFTRRAFANGRIDLTRAEGVLALVEARSQAERRAATALLFGGLERRMEALRDVLDGARALVEASLDFDESDTGHVPTDEVTAALDEAGARLDEARAWEVRRAADAAGARAVLVGLPNAGKSSIFNALARRGADGEALVAEVPGTTRDAKEAPLDLARFGLEGGVVTLVDTAGLEPSGARELDEAERRAQAVSRAARESADVLVHVLDARVARRAAPESAAGGPGDPGAAPPGSTPVVVAWNQVDRAAGAGPPDGALPCSAVTGAGLPALVAAVVQKARGAEGGRAGAAITVAHRAALEAAGAELERAGGALGAGLPLDLVAQHLREATDALDRIVGRTTPEDLLDRIFARFCLGK